MASRLVLGTRNRKKRDELAVLLGLPGLALVTLDDFRSAPEVAETGDSFAANARLKAVTLARSLGEWVLGEDSGLMVDALDGAPGIYSARYAGKPGDDARNNEKLLGELADRPNAKRSAHYVCAAVVSDPAGLVRAESIGRCDGEIARSPRGTGGFGYDPLFVIPETGKTFGELPARYKQSHSHRASAIALLRPQLVQLIEKGTLK